MTNCWLWADATQRVGRRRFGDDPVMGEISVGVTGVGLTEQLMLRFERGDADPALFIALSGLVDPNRAIEILAEGRKRCGAREVELEYIRALEGMNRAGEAVQAAREALKRFPGDGLLNFKAALALPVLYDSSAELAGWRSRYAGNLETLIRDIGTFKGGFDAISNQTNFFLGYQAQNDRELQERYGVLVHQVLQATYPALLEPLAMPAVPASGRLRIGFISAHLRPHVVSTVFGNWILGRHREKVEVFAYQIRGSTQWPAGPNQLAQASDHFRHLKGDYAANCAAIRTDQLHAAVLLDVGMARQMTLLAASRLAPVQCVAWGHPVTTGLRNVDYFLSNELMEPANSADHYSEELVRLPGIGVCYPKPLVPRAIINTSRARFGLKDDSVVFLCCQAIQKYLPGDDDLFVRIALEIKNAQFVFAVPRRAPVDVLRQRLGRAFAAQGLSVDEHMVVLPYLPSIDYLGLHLTADVFLDSIGFTGLNTTADAIACGLPVVTLRAATFRGRQSAGMLAQMDVTDTVARDRDDYVAIAVRLGLQPEWRREISARLRGAADRLFNDTRSIGALEEFLGQAVRDRARAGSASC